MFFYSHHEQSFYNKFQNIHQVQIKLIISLDLYSQFQIICRLILYVFIGVNNAMVLCLEFLCICFAYIQYIIQINKMGIKGSTTNNQFNELLKEYEIVRQIDNQGLYYLKNNKSLAEYLLRQFTFNDRKEFDKNVELLENRKSQLHGCKHLVSLQKLIVKSQDQYCSTFYKIYGLFPFTDRTLENEIVERNIQKRKFQEKDLWSILASCILGLSHLQKHNIKHQALRSNSILISEEGVVKVYDILTTGCQTNYDTLISKRSTPHIYLSPQLTQSLQLQTGLPNSNPYKSDIFTLGIIILQAGLSNYQDECYRDECSRIHWQTVQYNIHRFKQIYSQDLTNLIQLMLSNQQRNRPDWIQLQQRVIKQKQEEINNKVKGNQFNKHHISSFDQKYNSNKINNVTLQKNKDNNYMSQVKNQYKPYDSSSTSIKNYPINHQIKTINNYQHLYKTPINSYNVSGSNNLYKSSFGYTTINNPSIINSNNHLIPINKSNIQPTRPLKCIFPSTTYITNTLIDQNLIIVPEQQKLSSTSTNNIYQNGQNHLSPQQQFQNSGDNNFKTNYYNVFASNGTNNNLVKYYAAPLINTYPFSTGNNQYKAPYVHDYSQIKDNNSIESKNSIRSQADMEEYVIEKYKQGSQYKGYKKNGMRHGFGVFYYQDGGMYQGQWKFNKMQGKGKLFYQSGKLAYEGNWSNDKFSGEGSLHNQSPQILGVPFDYKSLDDIDQYWTKFEGDFQNDMKNGRGILFLSNGQYFEGQFKQDMAHGQGTFYRLNGQKINGKWLNNAFMS